MKLKKWLEKNEITPYQFAHAMDCTPASVYFWIKGSFFPSKHLMKKIEEVTNGKVTAKDFKEKSNDK